MRAPSELNFSGYFRNSTTSWSSVLASSTPATSANVTTVLLPRNIRARLLPKLRAWLLVPWAWRIMKKMKPPMIRIGSRPVSRMPSHDVVRRGLGARSFGAAWLPCAGGRACRVDLRRGGRGRRRCSRAGAVEVDRQRRALLDDLGDLCRLRRRRGTPNSACRWWRVVWLTTVNTTASATTTRPASRCRCGRTWGSTEPPGISGAAARRQRSSIASVRDGPMRRGSRVRWHSRSWRVRLGGLDGCLPRRLVAGMQPDRDAAPAPRPHVRHRSAAVR